MSLSACTVSSPCDENVPGEVLKYLSFWMIGGDNAAALFEDQRQITKCRFVCFFAPITSVQTSKVDN